MVVEEGGLLGSLLSFPPFHLYLLYMDEYLAYHDCNTRAPDYQNGHLAGTRLEFWSWLP